MHAHVGLALDGVGHHRVQLRMSDQDSAGQHIAAQDELAITPGLQVLFERHDITLRRGLRFSDGEDIDARDWSQVLWALSTRVDPARDSMLVENTPIDYLDFASPEPGLGSKLGLDATQKWPGETTREWGRVIVSDPAVEKRMQALWQKLQKGSD